MADVEMGGCDPSPSSVQNVRIPACENDITSYHTIH